MSRRYQRYKFEEIAPPQTNQHQQWNYTGSVLQDADIPDSAGVIFQNCQFDTESGNEEVSWPWQDLFKKKDVYRVLQDKQVNRVKFQTLNYVRVKNHSFIKHN